MSKDMTRGNPLGLILKFFIPVLLGSVFQQFYSMVDTIVVGKFVGVNALAGVGATGSINFLILGFAMGAGLYTLTLIVHVFLLCILAGFPSFETYLKDRSNHFEIHMELKNSSYLRDFVTVSRRLGLRIDDIEANQAYAGSGLSVYSVSVTICSAELKKYKTHVEIIEALSSLDYIYHIEEMH